MKELKCFLILLAITAAFAQRVVPGVNPQHYQQQQQYQQQVPQMQYAQPGQVPQMQPIQQQQMHQQPMHQQQMPQQQMPQQPMMQQPPMPQQPMMQQPMQQQPHHQPQQQFQHDPNAIHQQQHMRPQILDATNLQGDKAHIQDHIEVPLDTSKMSEQELQFHYFKMHDTDHNNKLDGAELIKSLIHWHEKGSKEDAHQHEGGHQDKIFSDEELIALIDPILEMDDTSGDGFIDYPEFIKAQEKAAAQNKAEAKP